MSETRSLQKLILLVMVMGILIYTIYFFKYQIDDFAERTSREIAATGR